MASGANGTISTCSGTFKDGGGNGNYASNQSSTITFCPSTPGSLIRVSFTSFDTEDGYDYLEVWNGNTVSGAAADTFMGTLGAFVVTSSSPDGCLTFRFTSDSLIQYSGWSATISCVTPCTPPVAAMVSTATVDLCPSTSLSPGSFTVPFNASNSTTASGSIVRYEWDWGDGTSSITAGPNTTHTFPSTGGYYIVRLKVRNNITTTDPLGCLSTNSVTRVVRVMPEPSFAGTTTGPIPVNCGDSVTLNGLALSQTIVQATPSIVSSPVSLPDGSGSSYTSSLDFSGLFPAGSTVTAGCYPTLTFNLEHSYSGDLEITLIAPSGQSVMVYDQHGGGTHFGTCANAADNGVPGCVATYTVVNSGGVAWTAAGVTTTATSTCGTYGGACETGNYYISQTYNSTNPFSAFNGATMNGVWTLQVKDNLTLDDGVLSNWSLTFPASCYGSLQSATPDLTTATWSTTGSGPAVPAQTTTSTVVNNPGPTCPPPGPCVGNSLANNVTIGPFPTAGSYVYSFTVTDEFGCQYRRNVTINVTCPCPSASISYTGSPFCNVAGSQAVTLTGVGSYTGGTYSATPAGLSINTTTGAINTGASTPGTYTVTYSLTPGGGCPVINATTSVTISATPTASVTSTTPICSGNNAVFNVTGTPNATVTYNINGGAAQTVVLSAAGTATVTVPSVVANTTFNGTSVASSGTPLIGLGLSATGGNTPANATGAISASGAAANATNCAFVDGSATTLTITLQHTVPAGTNITVSIAKDTNPGAVNISDGTATIGTFNSGTNDVLQYITVTTTVATNTIVITRTGGIVWVDGVQYTYIPVGCTTPLAITNTVVVNPVHTITAGSDQTVCMNSAMTAITMTLGGGATGATVTGLPTGVSSSVAGTTLTISGTPSVTGTFPYTVTTTGNACTVATTSGTITVNPIHTITAGSDQTVCMNSAMTAITMTLGGGATGATVTGLPTGVSSSVTGTTLTISGTPSVTGTFPYTVTTTGNACTVATTSGTITVNPIHTITAGSDQTVCMNSAMTAITMTLGGGATGATVTGLPTGVSSSVTGTTLTISGTPSVTGTFPYTVTTTGNACTVATTSGTITVNPIHTITAGSDQTVCMNSAMTAITMTLGGGATGATVTGLPTGVSSSVTGTTLTISGTPSVTGTFPYTVTTTGNACTVATTSGTITVNPILSPTINCGTSTTTSVQFNWAAVTGATGYNLSYQINATPVVNVGAIGNVLTYSLGGLSPGDSVTITLTPTGGVGACFTFSTATCVASNCVPPTASINYASSPFCSSTASGSVTLTGTGTYTGGTYTSTAGLTIDATTGAITPSTSTPGTYTVTYTIPAVAGCSPVTTTTDITITPMPSAT
ncbi:hypothetical protein Q764_03075, partial [Flavobacterium suncheonense GH29-5 = DSM 17707]